MATTSPSGGSGFYWSFCARCRLDPAFRPVWTSLMPRDADGMRLTPSQRSCNKSSRFFLNKCPIAAALAFVGCGFCRDGASDAGINRLDAPKVKLCRVSVSRTVSGGECAASCADRHLSASLGTFLVSTTSFTERTQSLKYSRVGACQ
jgi:hypothetical protein